MPLKPLVSITSPSLELTKELFLLASSTSTSIGIPIPTELGNLTNLVYDQSHFEYNALYTDENWLRDFLNSKQMDGDWEITQTIAPTDVMADLLTEDSVIVSWTPIRYNWSAGGYRIFLSTNPGGSYTLFDETTDKNASSLTINGLNPGTTYYFVIQTVTYPHGLNVNTVLSEYSEEVSAATISINEPPVADAGED